MTRRSKRRAGPFRSKLEEKFDQELQEAGCSYSYEADVLDYVLKPRKYTPDFTVLRSNGKVLFLEVKGYLRPQDRTKMVAVKKCNPQADIRFVFAKNQPVNGTKMMYSDWCKKYGFPYCFGKIPKRWLK